MITGFEVGALFKIIDDATPGLKKILDAVTALNAEIKLVRDSMASFSTDVTPGMAGAIRETNSLAAAWLKVGEEATLAARAIKSAAAASVPSAGIGAAAAHPHPPGCLGGTGAHLSGPGVGLPGGIHARLGGTPAMIGAGLAAYGIYEAANMEDAVWQMIYHSAQKNTKE